MELTPFQTQMNQPLFSDVVSIRDNLSNNSEQQADGIEIITGELSQAFAMLDPVLANLYKEMKSAAAELSQGKQSKQLIDSLKWRYETAESAYQTRLLEVRQSKIMKEAALTAINGDEIEAKCQLHKMTMQQKMNEEFAQLRERKLAERRKKEEESQGGFFFYFMLGLWLAQMQSRQVKNQLEASQLRSAFTNAKTT